MKLIKPNFCILEQEPGIEGLYKSIEKAGRVCYKSESKITEGSAEKFVANMVKSGHGAMLEHGTIYLTITLPKKIWGKEIVDKYYNNKYSKVNNNYDNLNYYYYITTNYRVLVENGWLDDLKYMCEPTEYHERRVCVKFTSDIGISREFNRHRVNSMAEQSTRYCNYSKDKFSNELTIIKPEEILDEDIKDSLDSWKGYSEQLYNDTNDTSIFSSMCDLIAEHNGESYNVVDTWLFANLACQWSYMRLLKLGWKPQQARRVLPLDLQTELVHTAFVSDWVHFFSLRDDPHAHPQAIELAHPLHEEFIKRGYIK